MLLNNDGIVVVDVKIVSVAHRCQRERSIKESYFSLRKERARAKSKGVENIARGEEKILEERRSFSWNENNDNNKNNRPPPNTRFYSLDDEKEKYDEIFFCYYYRKSIQKRKDFKAKSVRASFAALSARLSGYVRASDPSL